MQETKIEDRTFYSTATQADGYLHHFGICPELALMWGNKPSDILHVEMKVSEDQNPERSDAPTEYWGWLDTKSNDFSQLVYKTRFILEMCFAGGILRCEELGLGKAYRLNVEIIQENSNEQK